MRATDRVRTASKSLEQQKIGIIGPQRLAGKLGRPRPPLLGNSCRSRFSSGSDPAPGQDLTEGFPDPFPQRPILFPTTVRPISARFCRRLSTARNSALFWRS